MRPAAAFLFAVLCLAPAVTAQDREQPVQELFLGDSVYVQDRGEVQVTVGVSAFRSDGHWDWDVTPTFQYGLTPRLEIDASAPVVSGAAGESSGFGDASLALNYGLSTDLLKGAWTVGLEVSAPTGDEDRGRGAGNVGLSPHVSYGKAVGAADVHVFAGAERHAGAPVSWTTGAAWVRAFGRWRPVLEADAVRDGGEWGLVGTPGLYLKLSRYWEVGAAVPFRIAGEAPGHGVVVLLTYDK
jgi:hypothetical protein